jgi:hypothetical protein
MMFPKARNLALYRGDDLITCRTLSEVRFGVGLWCKSAF